MGAAGTDVSNVSCFERDCSTYRPEVVHKNVEDAQNHDKHNGTPLRLESNRNHDTSHSADQNHKHSPEAPLASEDEADEQEDEKDTTSKLEVHFAVLLVELGETCWGELLAHPAVRQDHDETAHDGEISQEEVEVEDEAVAQRLRDDHADQATDCELAMFAGNDEDAASGHCDNVDDQEEVVDSPWHCSRR